MSRDIRGLQAYKRGLRDGTIVRPEICSACDDVGVIDGHHPDYKKGLEVVWLCQPCHMKVHKPAAVKPVAIETTPLGPLTLKSSPSRVKKRKRR